jgi:hypothetical protein
MLFVVAHKAGWSLEATGLYQICRDRVVSRVQHLPAECHPTAYIVKVAQNTHAVATAASSADMNICQWQQVAAATALLYASHSLLVLALLQNASSSTCLTTQDSSSCSLSQSPKLHL